MRPIHYICQCTTALALSCSIVYADCDPVVSGAVVNLAAECFNESAALVVDPSAADANGWQYADDTNQDSVNGNAVGNTPFEIFGLAFSERIFPAASSELDRYQLCLVINSNLPLAGTPYAAAEDGIIGWGDLLVNFGTGDFLSTSDNSELFGVKFASDNDSGVLDVGTYTSVMSKSVTSVNSGFASWNAYASFVTGKGKIPTMGDLGTDPTSYFAGSISNNVIKVGTLISNGVTFFNDDELEDLGYDVDRWSGTNTGFCWRKWDWIDPCGVLGGDGSACRHCGILCGPGGNDTDSDGTKDCADECDDDSAKVIPGQCGCGVADTDNDSDGTANCNDDCADDSLKTTPGLCGCGVADTDSDSDSTPDCNDDCADDSEKTTPGVCGCGIADSDSDQDGLEDCLDECVDDSNKVTPGICGCGVADTDSDNDGTFDCNDLCPADENKTDPGNCGCGFTEHFCEIDSLASCGDGKLHRTEQCDDGNDEIGDGCVNCKFEDDLVDQAECSIEDISDLQRTLDGLAKRLEHRGRKFARIIKRLSNARGQSVGKWLKQIFTSLHANQVAAWTAIWVPSSLNVQCNEEGEAFCVTVDNTESLEIYRKGINSLIRDSRSILRRLKREATLVNDTRTLRKARSYRKMIRRYKREALDGLSKMPESNLQCADVVLNKA